MLSILVHDQLCRGSTFIPVLSSLLPGHIAYHNTLAYHLSTTIVNDLPCLLTCLELYFSHLELRGSYVIKILHETGLERLFWTTGAFSKSVVWCCTPRRGAQAWETQKCRNHILDIKTSISSVLMYPNHP
jgi:hypothetical protein